MGFPGPLYFSAQFGRFFVLSNLSLLDPILLYIADATIKI
ncbi:hypothetical protein PP2015_787 [Pseudoalteromonas phenolica]|uniref:Uncharacterized protein n=1 Tax=Pseudoalteromonas phenolica TaxID=161398 RepID=A0A0S2JYQ9_9GAMM|nr:hypothetical protein PP2015_787 [Pseudoalteromonas phenolica]MBE0354154.1 hypothetical protein [Pseudoalteromonas phenolica O-BC30]